MERVSLGWTFAQLPFPRMRFDAAVPSAAPLEPSGYAPAATLLAATREASASPM